jgi:hypothetical protein
MRYLFRVSLYMILGSLGEWFERAGRHEYRMAVWCYLKGCEIAGEGPIVLRGPERNTMAACDYNNIAVAYRTMGDFANAMKYYELHFGVAEDKHIFMVNIVHLKENAQDWTGTSGRITTWETT